MRSFILRRTSACWPSAVGSRPCRPTTRPIASWPGPTRSSCCKSPRPRWGQVPYAVPFGSAVLTCYYRRRPARALSQASAANLDANISELAEFFARRENLGDAAPSEARGSARSSRWPTAGPAACCWRAPRPMPSIATIIRRCFNIDTMEPLIAGAPFVRALEELVADAKLGPANALELDPAAARREFLAGRAALALAVPGHAAAGDDKPTADNAAADRLCRAARFARRCTTSPAELGRIARRTKARTCRCWASRAGWARWPRKSPQPSSAFQLLAWLSGREWGATVSSASPATTLYRRSQVARPATLARSADRLASGAAVCRAVRDALGRQAYLSAAAHSWRQEKYLAALDAAVHASRPRRKVPRPTRLAKRPDSGEDHGRTGSRSAARRLSQERGPGVSRFVAAPGVRLDNSAGVL